MPATRPITLALLLAAAVLPAAPAQASIPLAPTQLDGPSADILGVDGVAMSRDGTGGLVYRRRDDGRVHVYVARYVGGAWLPPQRVDVGQDYNSSFPAIGAGDGGRLVVTWIHEFGGDTQDRMYSAVLDPGASSFQAPIALDLDVRDGTDAYPSLSMDPGGTAYLAYRVVYSRSDPSLPPGTVDADIRVARFTGQYWSLFGNPVDRNPAQPMRTPTPTNGPQIATDSSGNAVVAWSEPDDDLIDRVYARRLFGMTPGNVLQASPGSDPADASKPLRAGPDQFSLDVSPFGAAAIAYHQQPASGSSFSQARAELTELGASTGLQAGTLTPPRAIDGGGADGPGGLGPVSVAVDDTGAFDAGLGVGNALLDAGGDPTSLTAPVRLDDGSSDVPPDPLVDRGAAGELDAAWTLDQGGAGGVGLLLRGADGSTDTNLESTDAGGAVSDLHLAGSGLGDAAVAFLQGGVVSAATIDAPPEPFNVAVPLSWVRAGRITLTWDPSEAGIGTVRYTVGVDGQVAAKGLAGTQTRLNTAALDDGRHAVTVTATDPAGQNTTTKVGTLMLDRHGPKIAVTVRGAKAVATVRDAVSGVAKGAKVVWGDGKHGKLAKRASHRYARLGRYRVTVTAKDHAGNRTTLRKQVSVR